MSKQDPDLLIQLARQIDELSARVARIERSLRVRHIEYPPPANTEQEQAKAPPIPPPAPVVPVISQLPHVRPLKAPPPAHRYDADTLEAKVGQNWASWVGGIVLLVGVAFFLKYAWDQGWIRPSPTVRVLVAVGLGVGVIVAGEWMLRRALRPLAGTLYGTGIAIIMAAMFGAAVYFDPPVLGRTAAGVGVLITAVGGVAISLRANMMVVAILSLTGAYLSPLVLRTGEDRSLELMAYLLILAGVGWVVSFLKGHEPKHAQGPQHPRPWNGVRWFSAIATWIWVWMWWEDLGYGGNHDALGMGAAVGFFCGFMTEQLITSFRTSPTHGQGVLAMPVINHLALVSMATTASCFGTITWMLDGAQDHLLAAIAVGMSTVMATAAVLTPARSFAASAALQVAVLLTLAVPLATDRFATTFIWMAMAGALGALAWVLDVRAARRWAVALLGISLIRLVSVDYDDRTLDAPAFDLVGQNITQWVLAAWGLAVLAHVIAWLYPRGGAWPAGQAWAARVVDQKWSSRSHGAIDYASVADPSRAPSVDRLGIVVSCIGTLVFGLVAEAHLYGLLVTFLLLGWLGVLIALVKHGRQLKYAAHAMTLALIVSARWLIVDSAIPLVEAWTHPELDLRLPLLNLANIAGGLSILACVVVARWVDQEAERRSEESAVTQSLAWVGVLVFALLNFDAWRLVDLLATRTPGLISDPAMAKQMAMSVLWSVIGLVAVVAGFRQRIPRLRYAALLLLFVTLAKILIIDMADVQRVWRILSFIAVGGLLLCVSYVYHRNRSGETDGGEQ